MSWGSVQFYKKAILSAIIVLAISHVSFTVYLLHRNLRISQTLTVQTAQNISDRARIQAIEKELCQLLEDKNNIPSETENCSSFVAYVGRLAGPSFEYQQIYPDLKCPYPEPFVWEVSSEKTVFLTFDDGPSEQTTRVLDILKEKGIKATFFVVYTNQTSGINLYKRIVAEGHSIGAHTYSHNYTKIYATVETFLDDFNKVHTQIFNVTGIHTQIFRFPGGSINSYNTHNYKEIIAEMLRRGFIYHDWNVSSRDAERINYTSAEVYNAVITGVANTLDKSIVLMHDSKTKKNTVEALPRMIDELKSRGYHFDVIRPTTKPVTFFYVD